MPARVESAAGRPPTGFVGARSSARPHDPLRTALRATNPVGARLPIKGTMLARVGSAAGRPPTGFVGARSSARPPIKGTMLARDMSAWPIPSSPISSESVEKNDSPTECNARIMIGWRARRKVPEKDTPGFVEAAAALQTRSTTSHRQPRAGERFSATLNVVELSLTRCGKSMKRDT